MIENNYINALSSRLRNFKRKGNMYNFSCILCGDSEKKKFKARAYIYEKKGKSWFHCHNCGVSMLTAAFIKTIDQNLYSEYLLEKLKNEKSDRQKDIEEFSGKMNVPEYRKTLLKNLKKVSQLSSTDPIKKLVVSRKIPNKYHAKLFECLNFMAFTNTIIPNKFDEKALLFDEKRLLIPFISASGEVHAFQGRSINKKSELRYITIVLDDTIPKVYGLDTVNFNLPVHVFEGVFDSFFMYNSIAAAGGDITSTLQKFSNRNFVICYDNEPRAIHTIKKIENAIQKGYKVFIFPDYFEYKDINEAIMAGISIKYIEQMINNNTYENMAALLRLTQWKKC